MEDLDMIPPLPAVKSNLELVNECDSFPYPDTQPEDYAAHLQTYFHLYIPPCEHAVGYLLPSVALTLKGIKGWQLDEEQRTLTLDVPADAEDDPLELEKRRSAIIAHTTQAMRSTDHFAVLRKWRDELYPIYYRDPTTRRKTLLANMERAASPLFGITTYGAHMTAYTNDKEMSIWVARRAKTKQTYPGMLDQTVAGGLSSGESAEQCLVRESEEEASLDAELVRRKARAGGTVTYFHIRGEEAGGETRLLQPECQYVYDLDLTGEAVEPKSGDADEVEGFELLTVSQVKAALGRGEFKPNCALVILDFFIRHGIVTSENEEDYCEIVTRLHRRLEIPAL